jgi:poly-gamma-glutamate system protein
MTGLSSILGRRSIRLLAVFCVAASGLALAETRYRRSVERPDASAMRQAAARAAEWFEIVAAEKERRGIESDAPGRIRYRGMLGCEWSPMTTTLGSLEAKETAANPEFAALVVRWLDDAGVGPGDRVGVTLSGSFPSLAICVFAALETLGIEATVLSSVGASSYGANQPDATWIDIESWLAGAGASGFRSSLVTMGAEWDAGGGLSDEGIEQIRLAARRCRVELFVPGSLEESIAAKTGLLERDGIKLLINVGGNQAALGACPHAATIPNGYHRSTAFCRHEDRGVMFRLAEKGIPYIHLINIRDLAIRYGIDGAAGPGGRLYHGSRSDRSAVIAMLILIAASCAVARPERFHSTARS